MIWLYIYFDQVFCITRKKTNLKFLIIVDILKMPPKRKGRGRKNNAQNKEIQEKQQALQKLWDSLQNHKTELECHLNALCQNTIDKIHKQYDDRLKALPEHVRKMTLSEYMEMQRKSEVQELSVNDIRDITSEFSKTKLLSTKKTLKKNKTERKRSVSVSVFSTGKGIPQNSAIPRISRVLSESSLSTPLSKRPSYCVTPKFNPNAPLTKALVRKPRAGEVVMSLSGSPLLNLANNVAVSMDGITILTDDADHAKLEADYGKKLDDETKQTLETVKKKLEEILKSN